MTKPYILPFILVLFCSYTLSAQSALRNGEDYAIFFYCTSFDNGWTALPETEEEVKAIGALLKSDYGFQPHYIKNPSKADIKDEIAKWNARVRPNDQVLYFFSTHGYYDAAADEGFLVPHNGKLRDTYGDTWLSYAELGRRVTKCKSKHVLLALDACYSGAFGDRYKGQPGGTPWEADADCADQVENALAYPTRRYFTSGSKNQRTPARSLFADRWLTALRKGQEKGVVRIRDLRYYLGSIPNPKPEDGSFTGHEDGGFVFVHRSACRGSGGSSLDQDRQHWQQILPSPSRSDLLAHLRDYPGCPHYEEALQRLESESETGKTVQPTRPRDLPDMIFVEGGTFQMGSSDSDADSDETPHTVTVDDFYLHRFEVTNAEFAAFLNAEGNQSIGGTEWYEIDSEYANIEKRNGRYYAKSGYDRHPVMEVSWYGAVAYCNWKSKQDGLQQAYQISGTTVSANWKASGYRLPTEAEWEFAARSRGKDYKYAWGNGKPHGNIADESAKKENSGWTIWEGYDDGYAGTAPVGMFEQGALGFSDLTGNVWEWCWDWYDGDYYKNSPSQNPRGPSTGSYRVNRGGGWFGNPQSCRAANRSLWYPTLRHFNVGFRLAHSSR